MRPGPMPYLLRSARISTVASWSAALGSGRRAGGICFAVRQPRPSTTSSARILQYDSTGERTRIMTVPSRGPLSGP
jgi:hypothetical protein